MSYLSHSQEPTPASGTDHAVHTSQNDFYQDLHLLTDYRQTLVSLLQVLDADEWEVTNEDFNFYPSGSPVLCSTRITQPTTSKIQTEIKPSLIQQEMTKTEGKEKEKERFPDRSSMSPLLEYLQGFDFETINDHEMDEEVEPFPSLACSSIYTRSFLDSWNYGSLENVCITSPNAIAGPSRVTLDDLERSERRS